MQDNIVILDINSHIHRCYNVANSNNKKTYFNGRPNHSILNSISLIEKEIKVLNINFKYVVCVLDHESKNFRHELYPDYKKNRNPTKKEFNFIRNCVYKMLSLKGYFTIRKAGVEADDVIGTITKKAEKAGLKVYICTDDKDLFQLISDNVYVYRGKIKKLYHVSDVIAMRGIHPKKILDYLTIDGDVGDNIAGIPNCGKVTCLNILNSYDFATILNNPSLLLNIKIRNSKKIIKYIEENKEFILLMRKLIVLKDNMDLGLTLKDFKVTCMDHAGYNKACQYLGLSI